MQKTMLKKRISLLLTLIMLITMIPAMAFAEEPVVTDATDLDVFMNIDPTLGIDNSEFTKLVEGKLDKLNELYEVENDTKSYRFKTSAASIDPTDITKWEVYSHYDKAWYLDAYDWYTLDKNNLSDAAYNSGDIPSNWYYYGIQDVHTGDITPNNEKTTIPNMLDDVAGKEPSHGTSWGNAAGLDSHIYAYREDTKPAMQFYGYGSQASGDFLYYPASASSKKSVKFNIDASNVHTHSLSSAGFLINAGTIEPTDPDDSKTITGYLITFSYSYDSNAPTSTTKSDATDPATGLSAIYLYKLTNANVDNLHKSGISGASGSYSIVASITNTAQLSNLFHTKSHIELEITSDSLSATLQEINPNGSYGTATDFFDHQDLDETGYGGFGPYVNYSGHSCNRTSSFRFSNLEMSFAENLSGSSALEAYQYADYLHDSGQKFFVNLTSDRTEKDYSVYGVENDTDKAYLNMITADETVLITDEHTDTYLADTLKGNAKDVNDIDDDVVIPRLVSEGANAEEILAAKVAWLIYSSIYDPDLSTVDPPETVATASLLLLDGPGTSGSSWGSAKQVNQIKKELISEDGLKVYLNPDNSQNTKDLIAAYTLTKPNSPTETLATYTDTANNNKLYFIVPKTYVAGDYRVTLNYATGGPITSVIPAVANYSILTDSISPTASVSISGTAANLTFENTTAIDDETAYTSQLDSYTLYIDTSGAKPTVDESDYIPVSGTSASVNVATVAQDQGLTLEADTTYYLHVLLKDEAGNVGHAAQSFTFDAPTVAFTSPAANTYTAESPYEGTSVTFSLTASTHSVDSYKIGKGTASPTYNMPVSAAGKSSVDYVLPVGIYRLWISATDTEGNESAPISIYVDNRKAQQLNGTDNYTFEAGVDDGAVLDYTSSSSPALEDGEALGEITYDITSNPSNAILVTDGAIKVNKYVGTATITVTAAETSTHHQATHEITVRVVRPFTVSLTSYYTDTDTGITLIPGYADEGNFGVSSTRELKYRKSGTDDWTTVPTSDWNWNTEYTIDFSGLDAEADYEVMLSGQNARTTATTSTATLLFKTPNASATGTGTITLKDTESGDSYNVSIQSGETVLDSGIVTGNGSDVPYTFNHLPDGHYNIVVVHDGPGNDDETVSKKIEIKDGVQKPANIVFEFIGSSSARFRMGDKSPAIAVDKLDDLLDPAGNTDDAAGMTVADKAVVDAGGKILIELVSKGLDESDVPEDEQTKLDGIKGGQTLAMLVDLSLFKTVWELNDAEGTQHQMTSALERLTVAIPLSNIKGSNVKVYRVHEGAAQLIPEAKLDTDGITYVWANDYKLDDSTTLTKGNAVGDAEYAVLSDGYAVLYVNKFSTYAIGYTPSRSSGSSRNQTTQTVTVSDSDHGKVSSDSTGKKEGGTVTVTATPDEGYVLSKLSIRDADGNTITYTEKSDGKYQFTMPSSAVTIKAEFEKEQVKPAKPADPKETGVAKWLITEDHIRYMVGDDNGYFNPANNMTRAEAAQMFYNLLLDKDIDVTASFSDVPEGAWYKKAVETLATLGVVTGYDGEYKANKYITRAEFTAIAMRFAVIAGGEAKFSDVADTDWAYQYIMSAAGYGWITGYADGTYKPQALITRAEVVNIVNNMLGRSADKDFIDKNRDKLRIFPDVAKNSYWAYYSIVEATNGHEYEELNGEEVWTEIK